MFPFEPTDSCPDERLPNWRLNQGTVGPTGKKKKKYFSLTNTPTKIGGTSVRDPAEGKLLSEGTFKPPQLCQYAILWTRDECLSVGHKPGDII